MMRPLPDDPTPTPAAPSRPLSPPRRPRSVFPPTRRRSVPLTALPLLLLALVATACSADSQPGEAAPHEDIATDTVHTDAHDDHDDEGGTPGRVTLSEAALRTAGIAVEPVTATTAATPATSDLVVPGQVAHDPARLAVISSRVPGRIERLGVVEGDRVGAGQSVALLYSPTYLTAQSDLQQAVRRADRLAGTEDETGARAIADAARRRLRTLGVGAGEIERLAAGGEPRTYLAITAPMPGSIVESHVLAGEAVEAGQPIFRLADLSQVDVVAEVPERALPLVRVGQRATISLAAYPDDRFGGVVERLHEELNPETRTVRAVIHAENPARRLRPGMFATVALDVPATAMRLPRGEAPPGVLLTIPESAVVTEGERRFVFVPIGPRTYERREVQVSSLAPPGSAAPTSTRVAVGAGLAAGDSVVVRGAFILKSELAKGSLGEHGH